MSDTLTTAAELELRRRIDNYLVHRGGRPQTLTGLALVFHDVERAAIIRAIARLERAGKIEPVGRAGWRATQTP
jgi:aryl-alcohol dehydrogenase-like predicted oxidoreductase